jgi:hypothetical protein
MPDREGYGSEADMIWGLADSYMQGHEQYSEVRTRSLTTRRAVVTVGWDLYRLVFVREGSWKLRELRYESREGE